VDDLGIMLVLGGYPYHKGVVYSLDVFNMKWSCIDNLRYKRHGHSADLIAGDVYLFGGFNRYDYKNDV
jgi:hypothetical protein